MAPDESCVTFAQCVKQHERLIDRLEETYGEKLDDLSSFRAYAEHSLDSGVKRFAELEQRVTQLEPKRIDAIKLTGLVVSVLVVLLSAWWFLGERLSERPTSDAVEQMFDAHVERPHPAVEQRLEVVKDSITNLQIEQRVMRSDVEATREDTKQIRRLLERRNRVQ